jgi:hypothetical protein
MAEKFLSPKQLDKFEREAIRLSETTEPLAVSDVQRLGKTVLRVIDELRSAYAELVTAWESAEENPVDSTRKDALSASLMFHDHRQHAEAADVVDAARLFDDFLRGPSAS